MTTTNNIFSWVMIMFTINVLILAGAMSQDSNFREDILTDLGEVFESNLNERLVSGTGDSELTGINDDSISFDEDYKDLKDADTDKTALQDLMDGLINLGKFLNKLAGIIGFAFLSLAGVSLLLSTYGGVFGAWIYLITVPLNLQSIRTVLRIIFPNRVD